MPGDAFDPLWEWLGIAAADQPPDHYRLLGLATFESDRAKIEAAADERMATVRRHQTGPRAVVTQQVLNRLVKAKQCLLDPATRSAYDAAIRGQRAASKSAAGVAKRPRLVERPPAIEAEIPPIEVELDFGVDATSNADRRVAGQAAGARGGARKKSVRPLMLASIALTLVTLSAGAWVLLNRGDRPKEKPPIIIVEQSPRSRTAPQEDAAPLVRPDGGVLRCTAENVSLADVHRRGGELLDLTVAEGRVEVSWTVRVRKAGFYIPTITYSAAGEGPQTFELELADETRRTTPVRATAGALATDELKAVAFRKTGDHPVVLRAAGKVDRGRTIKVRELQLRPIGLPAPEASGR